MSRGKRIPVWMVAAGALLTGCGDDDEGGGGGIPNSLALVAIASDLSLAASLGYQARTLADLGMVFPAAGVAPADTVLPGTLDCPVAATSQDSLGTFLTLEFGTECVSDLDGLPASGAAVFAMTSNGSGGYDMTAELSGYARQKRVLEGTLNVEQNLGLIEVNPRFLSLSEQSVSGVLSAFFVGVRQTGGSGPAYCEDWILADGGGSMTIGNFTYTIDVVDTLRISTCCPFPLEGEIMIGGGDLVPAFFDFGDGVCDNQARLTVSGESQTIALGYDF